MFARRIRIEGTRSDKTWRLWRATDVASLWYPNTLLFMFIGLFPFTCKPREFVYSKTRFVVSVITHLIYLLCLVLSLYHISVFMHDNTVEVIDMNFFFMTEGFMVLAMFALSYQRFILLDKLVKLSRMLSEQDINDMAKFVHTKDVFILISILVHVWNCVSGFTLVTVCSMTILYVMVVYFAIDMAYINTVYVIRACFIKINENLKQLNAQHRMSQERSSPQRRRSFLLLAKLKHYEQLYQDTSDVVEYLNKTFLLRIISAAIITFTVVTFNMYFAILWYGAGIWMNQHKRIWYVPYVEVVVYYLLKFAMMVMVCESAKNRNMEIGTTIHEILSNCTDETIKRELRYFALHVLHRENVFSAKAVTMNGKLLSQIIAGIVMYNLILFQFLLNHAKCDVTRYG